MMFNDHAGCENFFDSDLIKNGLFLLLFVDVNIAENGFALFYYCVEYCQRKFVYCCYLFIISRPFVV